MEEYDEPVSAAPPKLSKTPSWIMLGFILGGLFMWSIPRPAAIAPVASTIVEPTAPATRVLSAPKISTIEAIFSEWDKFAVWENDLTEVALWNPEVNKYSQFFEISRFNGTYYYRSISRLTRPQLTHGVPTESPLQFTETEEHRQRWLKDVANENRRSVSETLRDTFVGREKTETDDSVKAVGRPIPVPEQP